jgi:rhodanese-related sulfurtransferase
MTQYKVVSAENLDKIDPNEGIILDVRTPMEHSEKRLAFGHALVPLDELKPVDFMMRHGLDKESGVYILCRSGKRATQAAEKFIKDGYRNINVIEGGIMACEEYGHKINGHDATGKPASDATKRPIPLERQVRIAAGLIVAIGALLALITHPLFALVPLFVGCGLVFAGVTDRCGMALVLTKAPWNKGTQCGSCPPAKNNTGTSCQ